MAEATIEVESNTQSPMPTPMAVFHNPEPGLCNFRLVVTNDHVLRHRVPPGASFTGYANYKNFYLRQGLKEGPMPVAAVAVADDDVVPSEPVKKTAAKKSPKSTASSSDAPTIGDKKKPGEK